jgi:hypothetical protein
MARKRFTPEQIITMPSSMFVKSWESPSGGLVRSWTSPAQPRGMSGRYPTARNVEWAGSLAWQVTMDGLADR